MHAPTLPPPFSPPAGFVPEESFHTFVAAPAEPGAVRDNLVARRKRISEGTSLEAYAGQLTSELVRTLPEVAGLECARFLFADGARGLLIGYRYSAPGGSALRQYHALRLEAGVVTSITVTADDSRLTEARRDELFRSLSTARAPEVTP